jgi:sensor histidine kinase YesM
MTAEISTFGRENLSARMQDFPIDEFHQISVAFNKMATRIDHLITQVYEKQILATRSQVKFLQAQINPHFQFNVLSMLSLTAKKAGNEDLYAYLHAFSKLIQGKIFRDREIKIPVRGELELVNFYLQLQKGRFQEALDYEIHCSEERLLDCLIPKLLIEPLVENAVAHGLEPKGGQGKIDIHIDSRDDKLVISVSDNGVGFDSQCIETASPREGSSHTHTSLANTRRLLDILYQDNFEMTINGQKDRGTHIAIAIPMEEQKQCGQ